MKYCKIDRQIILAFLLFILLPQTFLHAQIQNRYFIFEGIYRWYKVFLPQNYQSNMPVVLNLHGYTLNAWWQMEHSRMNEVADTAGFIVVYPDAIYPGFNSRLIGYPGLPPLSTANDVGFISALIDTLETLYDIDMNRVYSCGFSNGGIMTYRLACEIGHRFAAVASVAGVLNDISGNTGNLVPSIPILHIHGTADGVVTYQGGIANLWSVDSTLNFWIQNNNCLLPPDTILLPDLDPNDGCRVEKISYANVSDTSNIVFYRVIYGGHSWPGALTNPFWSSYPTNKDINASVEIWNFFDNYDLSTSIAKKTNFTPGEFNLYKNYPNPFNPKTTISFQLPEFSFVSLKIYNLLGQEVGVLINGNKTAGKHTILWDASDFASGVYLYRLETNGFFMTKKMILMK